MGFWSLPKQKLNSAASSEGWLLSFEIHRIIKINRAGRGKDTCGKEGEARLALSQAQLYMGTNIAIKEWMRKFGEEQQLLRTGGCWDTYWISTDTSDFTELMMHLSYKSPPRHLSFSQPGAEDTRQYDCKGQRKSYKCKKTSLFSCEATKKKSIDIS